MDILQDPLIASQFEKFMEDRGIQIPMVVERIDPKRSRPYAECDILISSVYPEDRWSNLYMRMPRKQTILLGSFEQEQDIRSKLKNKDNEVLWYNPKDPREAVQQVLGAIRAPVESIALDITCLSAPVYFLLVRALLSCRSCSRLVLAYTEPDAYPQEDLTFGMSTIEPLNGYFGSYNPSKPVLLIALLGFEGRRTLAVYKEVAPDLTIAINPFPAFRPGWENRSLTSNYDFLMRSGSNERLYTAPATDPSMALQRLLWLYHNYRRDYNVFVSPLSSKPLGLAACLLAVLKEEVKVVYHFPHGPHQYAQGVGASWLYHFSVDDFLHFGQS
jgi:hypothetical protein